MERFGKSFTQQEPISEAGIARAVEVLRSGRLHRYNVDPGEAGPVAALERAFADYVGQPFCLAVTSGGQAMQIALRAAGIGPGDRVLTNAFTLAPVPGAIALVGAVPVLVETTDQLRPDLSDLDAKAEASGAKALLLSNMRGHLPDMEVVTAICARHDLILIEDCAHTMGATWKGRASGTFGLAGCFSTQTYKHMNSGEGGLLVSSDAGFMARATMLSGSYMMYARHGAGPAEAEFDSARYQMPNGSARMDALRAAILLDQIASLPDRIERWNALYRAAAAGLAALPGVTLPRRPQVEGFVGSSIQFLVDPDWTKDRCRAFVAACAARGVELKWFGAQVPHGFTSRFDHWHFAPQAPLPRSAAVLARLFDMRLPLTFTPADCTLIARIIADETAQPTEAA
jgi:dTDP-4-amino-4,6-dideoxygalactose transaminase